MDEIICGGAYRFIPTCVGNSNYSFIQDNNLSVHPHVCGELSYYCECSINCIGSSPRVWGTHACRLAPSFISRFIPTCVGNSVYRTTPVLRSPVHPHVCGELLVTAPKIHIWIGSSPRVWGTLMNGEHAPSGSRFIPTCVGNSEYTCQPEHPETVHPHVCGELHLKEFMASIGYGSSPRVWGTQKLRHRPLWRHRFIPTCVGNSKIIGIVLFQFSVHPHVCGELSTMVGESGAFHGSSPRVWGTRIPGVVDIDRARFIPTCVGNSNLMA